MDFPDRRAIGLSNDSDETESRMRDALGIGPARTTQNRGTAPPVRKQFVRDGQVQVEILQGRRAPEGMDALQRRVTSLQDELAAERSERIAAQRALAESRAVIQQLQTKLAHNELATAEALATEQQTRSALEQQLQELSSQVAQTKAAQARTAENKAATADTKAAARPKRADSDSDLPRKAAPSKRAGVKPAKEPKPVKWWLPSYQARKRK